MPRKAKGDGVKKIARIVMFDEDGNELVTSGNNTDNERFFNRVNKHRKVYTPEEKEELTRKRRENFYRNCGENMFKPGQSGNPEGGRATKTSEEVKKMMKDAAEDCLRVVLAKAQDPEDKDQYAAATQILDRVYGKPNQPIEENSNKSINVTIKRWGEDESSDENTSNNDE